MAYIEYSVNVTSHSVIALLILVPSYAAMLQTNLSGVVDPEDREIVDKLAKLQNMYDQVSLFQCFAISCHCLCPLLRN